ncbi:MAG: hypothetical protein DHS20C16_18430 [Phycisphaerae bacterium]|nr:MAG: hypothetical protein DHS20C16_18430 [Phycisphaerae bacterium]
MSDSPQPAKRNPVSFLMVAVLVFASLALPVFFWKGTWFGTHLTDDQIREYLTDADNPRKTQHALERITERIRSKDANVASFYPLIPPLASNDRHEIRMMAAWVMGWDTSGEGFQDALAKLVRDPVELVQRNAALSLSKFNDDRSKPVLLSMLEPFDIKSPITGTVSGLLQKGQPVRAGMEVAYLKSTDAKSSKIISPVDGAIKSVATSNGSEVSKSDTIYVISPAQQDMWEALRALLIVGDPEDIETIRANADRYATKPQIVEQAKETMKAIEKRAQEN